MDEFETRRSKGEIDEQDRSHAHTAGYGSEHADASRSTDRSMLHARGNSVRSVRGSWKAVCALLLVCGVALPIASQESARASDERFTLVLSATELTLDPLHAFKTTELQIATGIYEGLVVYDPQTLRPRPGVAYRWEVSEDRRTYTFHLRERARFSNGDPVTANDFRESWFRIIDPEHAGEYSFFFDVIAGAADYREGLITDREDVGIRAVDESTLEIELAQPTSHLLSMMCHMSHDMTCARSFSYAQL